MALGHRPAQYVTYRRKLSGMRGHYAVQGATWLHVVPVWPRCRGITVSMLVVLLMLRQHMWGNGSWAWGDWLRTTVPAAALPASCRGTCRHPTYLLAGSPNAMPGTECEVDDNLSWWVANGRTARFFQFHWSSVRISPGLPAFSRRDEAVQATSAISPANWAL